MLFFRLLFLTTVFVLSLILFDWCCNRFVINFVTPFGNLLSYFYRPDCEGQALNPDRLNDPAENLWKQFLHGDEVSVRYVA